VFPRQTVLKATWHVDCYKKSSFKNTQGRKMKSKIMIGVGAIVIIAVSVAASLYLTGSLKNKPPEIIIKEVNPFEDAQYVPLEPDFMVSFGRKSRPNAMVVGVTVTTTNEDAIEAMEQHMPVIRNNLLMLFGSQNPHDMETSEGKEALRIKTLETIQAVLKQRFGQLGIDDAFFTKFVTQ
jgi:flagellar FliL protein